MAPITVVVADDHVLVREGLQRLIAAQDDIEVAAWPAITTA